MRRFYLNFVGNAHFSYFVSLLFWLFIVLRTKKNRIFFFVASMEWGATAQRMTDLVGSILLIQTWSGTQSILLRLVDPYEKCIFRWLLFFAKAMAFFVWAFQSRTTRETDDWVRILLERGWYGCCCLFFFSCFLWPNLHELILLLFPRLMNDCFSTFWRIAQGNHEPGYFIFIPLYW